MKFGYLSNRIPSLNVVLTLISGLISTLGIATTISNMAYFRSGKYQLHTAEASTRHLYKMLNFFDLLVCLSTTFFLFHGELCLFPDEFEIPSGYWFCYLVLMGSVQVTGFITAMLTVARFINTVWSSYLLDCFAMTIAVVVFTLVVTALQMGPFVFRMSYDVSFIIQCVLLTCIFVLVISVSILILTKLNSSQSEDYDIEERRHTTLTVVMFSVIYCIFNVSNLVVLVGSSAGDAFTVPALFVLISTFVVLPLKSAGNPVVYISRSSEMREWLSNLWKKLLMGEETEQEELKQLSLRRDEISRGQRRSYN